MHQTGIPPAAQPPLYQSCYASLQDLTSKSWFHYVERICLRQTHDRVVLSMLRISGSLFDSLCIEVGSLLHQTGIEPTHMAPEAIALSTELLVLYLKLLTLLFLCPLLSVQSVHQDYQMFFLRGCRIPESPRRIFRICLHRSHR